MRKMNFLKSKKKNDNSNVVVTVDIDEEITNSEPTYFKCPTCGLMVQTGVDHCDYCGTVFDAYGEAISNPTTDKARLFFKKKKAVVIAAAALLIGGTGVNAGVDYLTQITVPNVEGMAAIEAVETLKEAGFEGEDIFVECDDTLSDSEIKNGEYEVVDQSVEEGEIVHSKDTITIDCKDLFKERSEALASIRYENAEDAFDVADKYEYKCDFTNINNDKGFANDYEKLSAVEKADYYVYEIKKQNDEKRQTVLTIDSKENIESEMDRLFSACVDKHVSDADSIAESLELDLKCQDYDNKATAATPSLVVTSIKGVDLAAKQVTLKTDTEQHIEDLKVLPTLKDIIPYEGLSERYISDTAVGKYDNTEDSNDNYDLSSGEKAYIWKSDDGKYEVLEVICSAGKVTEVNKQNEDVYWASAIPDFSIDKDEYDAKVAAAAAAEARKETTVWIPRTGSCYHSNPHCSNMKDPSEVTLSQAESWGYRACKKCY